MNKDDCIEWTGSRTLGYGYVHIPGTRTKKRVHRLEWEKHFGPIPKGLMIHHMCHNRACYNIGHLALTTAAGNQFDRRGTENNNKGSNHGLHKLTELDVYQIKQCIAAGEKDGPIAKIFKVSYMTIHSIRIERTWAHIKIPI